MTSYSGPPVRIDPKSKLRVISGPKVFYDYTSIAVASKTVQAFYISCLNTSVTIGRSVINVLAIHHMPARLNTCDCSESEKARRDNFIASMPLFTMCK